MGLYDCYDHEYESTHTQCPDCIKERLKSIGRSNTVLSVRNDDLNERVKELEGIITLSAERARHFGNSTGSLDLSVLITEADKIRNENEAL